MGHDTHDRLGDVRAPTLVVHGDADRMVPIDNGRRLAEAIPDARLLALPGAGHLYTTDDPGADRAVGDFLSEPTSPGPSSPAHR